MFICGPKTKQDAVEIEDSEDEVIIDDSEDLEELANDFQKELDDECNTALGDVWSDLIDSGYDIDNLFDPTWK